MQPEARWPRKLGGAKGLSWEDEGTRSWTGLHVLDGLVQAVHDLADGTRGRHRPVVVGCSPWLTDGDLVDALTRVHTCIVTTKPSKRASSQMRRLHREASPVPKPWLRSLDQSGLPDDEGHGPIEWTGNTYDVEGHDFDLGPVRVAGWRRPREGQHFPIIHAKVAVLGYHEHDFVDTGYGEAEVFGFLRDVLAISETFGDITPEDPSPELVDAYTWEPSISDLAYMEQRDAEYAAEIGEEDERF